ncbi:MAG: Asp23/Gls24 family envelope stress response protein [Christensenellales bacterium]
MNYQLSADNVVKNKGKVNCNKNVLLSIINLAAKEITGVDSLCTNFSSGLQKLFSNNVSEGVKITYNNDGITVDIYINVLYGHNITDVAHRVQENVKNGISSMIDVKVNSINVHIMGVTFGAENE